MHLPSTAEKSLRYLATEVWDSLTRLREHNGTGTAMPLFGFLVLLTTDLSATRLM